VLTATLEREQDLGVEYRLRRCLGRGSFGSVWEADSGDGDSVALKFMLCRDGLTASTVTWSLQAVRQLGHPHLVHIEDVHSHLGAVVVAMELADSSLAKLLQRGRQRCGRALPAEQVCCYLSQAAEAIDYLNGRTPERDGRRVAFQHCGIKPSNLLLFGDTVKLTDSGPLLPINVPLKFRHWGGPLDYAAPEVFQGRLSDWTDQYALAVTYCQLRGGRLPFTDTPATFERSYVRPEPNLTMLPDGERLIVKRALAPAAPERWPSCGEMMAQLRQAFE
jgi:serine/threonine protein kinase, bacterial